VIEDGEEGFEAALDTAVGGDIVSVGVPGSRGSVMAEVERDESDSGFDESASHECLLTPRVIRIASVGFGRFEREVEGFAGGIATDEFDGLLPELVGGYHEACAVDIAADAVEVLEEGATIVNAVEAEAFGELEDAIDVIGDEGIVFFAEPTSPGEVGGGFHGGDIGGDAGTLGAAEFSNDGGDGRVHVSERIDAGFGLPVPRLHDHVGFVVAFASINGTDEGEMVEHRGLFGEMLRDGDAGEGGGNRLEGAADFLRGVGFDIPHIDMAGTAGEPKEDDAAVAEDVFTREGQLFPLLEQAGEGDSRQSGEAGLEDSAPISADKPLPDARLKEFKRVAAVEFAVGSGGHREVCPRTRRDVHGGEGISLADISTDSVMSVYRKGKRWKSRIVDAGGRGCHNLDSVRNSAFWPRGDVYHNFIPRLKPDDARRASQHSGGSGRTQPGYRMGFLERVRNYHRGKG